MESYVNFCISLNDSDLVSQVQQSCRFLFSLFYLRRKCWSMYVWLMRSMMRRKTPTSSGRMMGFGMKNQRLSSKRGRVKGSGMSCTKWVLSVPQQGKRVGWEEAWKTGACLWSTIVARNGVADKTEILKLSAVFLMGQHADEHISWSRCRFIVMQLFCANDRVCVSNVKCVMDILVHCRRGWHFWFCLICHLILLVVLPSQSFDRWLSHRGVLTLYWQPVLLMYYDRWLTHRGVLTACAVMTGD